MEWLMFLFIIHIMTPIAIGQTKKPTRSKRFTGPIFIFIFSLKESVWERNL